MHRISISPDSRSYPSDGKELDLAYSAEGIYYLRSTEHGGPPWIEIAGRRLERLLDSIYVPVPLECLTATQISVVNSLRRELPSVIDEGSANAIVKEKFVALIKDVGARNVLEWGCGYDSIAPWLKDISYTAVDIDSEVVNTQDKQGVRCFHANDLLSEDSKDVDVIPAIFVFQFCISRRHAASMAEALGPSGIIVANVYRRNRGSRRRLRKTLRSAGLAVYSRPDPEQLCSMNEYWVATKGRSAAECSYLLDELCKTAV
jgi:hypothetical protein